jgi:hypothetical protein
MPTRCLSRSPACKQHHNELAPHHLSSIANQFTNAARIITQLAAG